MCFHSYEDMQRWEKRMKNSNPTGFIIMRDKATNAFQEAYYVDVRDAQAIANTIRNLRAWHPGDHVVDLSKINQKRDDLQLYPVAEFLDRNWKQTEIVPTWMATPNAVAGIYGRDGGVWYMTLPAATGEAPPSEDPDSETDDEDEMEEDDEEVMTATAFNYPHMEVSRSDWGDWVTIMDPWTYSVEDRRVVMGMSENTYVLSDHALVRGMDEPNMSGEAWRDHLATMLYANPYMPSPRVDFTGALAAA